MANSMKITNLTDLTKNMKFALKCSEHLMYKLFLIIETNNHVI